MPGGWDWDDDNASPQEILARENAERQFDEAVRIIQRGLEHGDTACHSDDVRTLNRVAMTGIIDTAGEYRTTDLEISGSRHDPPSHMRVPALVDEMCSELNHNDDYADPVVAAAYAMWRTNWIHPFDNGNGRTARGFSFVVLCRRYGAIPPGRDALPIRINRRRFDYIEALEAADQACREGQINVLEMARLIDDLLSEQTAGYPEPSD